MRDCGKQLLLADGLGRKLLLVEFDYFYFCNYGTGIPPTREKMHMLRTMCYCFSNDCCLHEKYQTQNIGI